MRKTNVETRKENEEEGWNTPNKTCEKEEGDEWFKAEEKDDNKEIEESSRLNYWMCRNHLRYVYRWWQGEWRSR